MRLIACALFLLLSKTAWADCDSLLLTGLDASSSVGADGISLEIHGMAEALSSPNVINMIQTGPNKCIGFAVYLWADKEPIILVDWTIISTKEDAIFAGMKIKSSLNLAIETVVMSKAGVLTDISKALEDGAKIFNASPIKAPKAVLNISGDGMDNSGDGTDNGGSTPPLPVKTALSARNIKINGIVFGNDSSLIDYYRENVTNGFVFRVENPEEWPAAFIAKFRLDLVERENVLQKGRL